jgi:hypothetical protein
VAAVLNAGLRCENGEPCGCGKEPRFRPTLATSATAGAARDPANSPVSNAPHRTEPATRQQIPSAGDRGRTGSDPPALGLGTLSLAVSPVRQPPHPVAAVSAPNAPAWVRQSVWFGLVPAQRSPSALREVRSAAQIESDCF